MEGGRFLEKLLVDWRVRKKARSHKDDEQATTLQNAKWMSGSESFWRKVRVGHASWPMTVLMYLDESSSSAPENLDRRSMLEDVPQREETDDTEEVAGTAKPLLSRHIRARAVARLGQSDHKASFQE